MIRFELETCDGSARAGRVHSSRGSFETPVFMPVGTLGTVKAMTTEELRQLGAGIVLSNTYHLHLRPGEEVVRALGGLHRFMHWEGPILTDSGGYQIYSLARLNRVSEEGVRFRSHLDGAALFLSPERAIGIQEVLGSDIMMCLDHVLALPADLAALEDAVERTSRWAARCLAAVQGEGALFAIAQGGTSKLLRRQSVETLLALKGPVQQGFAGYAIGGLSLGEETELMHETVAFTAPLLPEDQPRYVMGTGEPADLLAAIGSGVDMFDCVLPTRNARNGSLYTRRGKISIKQARYQKDESPVEANCPCPTCRHYSRGYLRHLYLSGEVLSMRLNTCHNLCFYLNLMREAREAIRGGHYAAFASAFLAGYHGGDQP